MRWFMFHCILLINLSIISAAENDHSKRKRDLAFVKNLIKSTIFGSDKSIPLKPVAVPKHNGNYKIFRIPGFNKVLVKAVPKVAVTAGTVADKVGVIGQDPTIALVSSYLGTKTEVETLKALERVNNLLQSGILTASREAMPIVSQPPIRFLSAIRKSESLPISPVMIDSTKLYTAVREVQNPMYVLPTVAERPVFVYHMPKPMVPIVTPTMVPVPVPNIVKTIRPVQMPVPVLPTNYSYKQIHGDGTVTSYTANDDHNVTVTKSDKLLPLPPFLANRLGKVIKLGTQTVSVGMPVVRPSAVQFIDYPEINSYRYVKPQVIGINNTYSYKHFHDDGTMTAYSSSGLTGSNVQVVTGVSGKPVSATTFTNMEKNNAVSVKLSNTTTRFSDKPNALTSDNDAQESILSSVSVPVSVPVSESGNSFSYKIVHSDGSVTTYDEQGLQENKNAILATANSEHQFKSNLNIPEYLKVSTNSQVSNNLASLASYENAYKVAQNALKTNSNVDNSLSVTPVTVAATGSNAVLFSNPVLSSYLYKQINHSSPNKFIVVNLDEPVRRDEVVIDNVQFHDGTNTNTKVENLPNNYVYIPPISANVPPLPTKHENMPPRDDGSIYMPPVSATAPPPIKPLTNNGQNTQEFFQESSLKTNPIVVLDDPMTYSYQQRNSDVSSVNIKSSQNTTVSVTVTPQNTLSRGDIPDASY